MKSLSFVFLLFLMSCPTNLDTDICLINNSKSKIYFYAGSFGGKPSNYISDDENFMFSVNSEGFTHNNFELYVFKEETLEKYEWDYIEENNLYDYRYDLSLQDLEAIDFKIVYTGEEEKD